MNRWIVALLITSSAVSLRAEAGVTPHKLPLQGQASDSTGAALVTDDLDVRIYDAFIGGTLIFDSGTDFHGAIQNGLFDVVLGGATVLALDNRLQYYLEIDIAGEEMIGDVNGGRYRFYPGGGSHDRPDLEARLDSLEAELGVSAVRPSPLRLAPAFPGNSANYQLAYGLLGIGSARGTNSNFQVDGQLLLQPVGEFSSPNYRLGLGPYRLIETESELVIVAVETLLAPGNAGSITVTVLDAIGSRIPGIAAKISFTSTQGLVVPSGAPAENPDTTYTLGFDAGAGPGLDTLVVSVVPATAGLSQTVPIQVTYFPRTVMLDVVGVRQLHPGESVSLVASLLDSTNRRVPDELTELSLSSLNGCGSLGPPAFQSDSSYAAVYTAGGAVCQDQVELHDPESTFMPRDTVYIEVTERAIITSVLDVANDQGRQVRVIWKRDLHDSLGASPPITEYVVWRRVDSLPSPGAPLFSLQDYHVGLSSRTAPVEGVLALAGALWEPVGPRVPAMLWTTYANVVPTLADSNLVQGIHYSVFFVSAHTADPQVFYSSDPDSGYSIDNLAPAAPQNLLLSAPGLLTWDEAPEADFDYFTVYGSLSATLDETAVVIGTTVAPTFDVSGFPMSSYFVTTTDFNGNEGVDASVANTVSTPGSDATLRLALHQCWPNPFRSRTTVSFELPHPTWVRLEVFDTRGRLIALLADRQFEAGPHAFSWNGRDDENSPVPAGLYFYRLRSHSGESLTRKLVVLR